MRRRDNFWENMSAKHWLRIPYPWKPDILDIIIYIIFIVYYSLFSQKNVLLLGATKQLRSVLSTLGIPYDLVDTSTHMENITRPTKKDTIQNFFITNWEEFVPKKEYSLILGDLILNLCSEEKMLLILSKNKHVPVLTRVRLPTKSNYDNAVSNFKKIILRIRKRDIKFIYLLLANMQTLNIFFKKEVDDLVPLIFQRPENLRVENFIENYFVKSPEYFLHEEKSILRGEMAQKRVLLCLRRPFNYLDSYGFLLQKKS